MNKKSALFAFIIYGLFFSQASADEPSFAIWGNDLSRNNAVVKSSQLSVDWNPGKFDRKSGQWLGGETARGIKWVAKLGSTTYGSPVIAGGKVFCTTNNGAGYLEEYPPKVDLGCLLAFDERTGDFLWQYSVEKLKDGSIDWAEQGICSNPVIKNNRLWIVNNRGEVVAINTETGQPVWTFDMHKELGVVPHQMTCCSPILFENLIITGTSNGIGDDGKNVANPDAPDLIALDQSTGKLIWQDTPCGINILDGQWGSPAIGEKDGTHYLYYPGGDGFLHVYRINPQLNPPLDFLWKFDCNPEGTIWRESQGTKNTLIATPVIVDDVIYIATGQDPESGDGTAVLWAFKQGETATPVWSYTGKVPDSRNFEEQLHRTIASATISQGLLLIGDFSGLMHCLDAKTGELCWTHDMMANIWGTALAADGKFYLGDSDGDLVILEASKNFNQLAEINLGASIYTAPTLHNGTIYISTNKYLFAIEK